MGRNAISGQTSRWKIEFFHERTDKWTNRVENVVRIVTRRFFLYTEMITIAQKNRTITYQSKFIIIRNDKNRSHTENVVSDKREHGAVFQG